VARHLGNLVEMSIVHRVVGPEPPLFQMLDTIREYGAERLRELGEERALRRRHRLHYLRLVRHAEAAWTGRDQLRWFGRLTREHGNLRAALDDAVADPDGGLDAQELAARLWFVWIAGGRLHEGRHYLERAVAANKAGESHRLAQWAYALIATTQGDLATAEPLAKDCLVDAITSGDTRLSAYATETLGMAAAVRGDLHSAVIHLSTALDYYRSLDDVDAGQLRSLSTLGIVRIMQGLFDSALTVGEECAALCRERGERWQRSYADYITALALRAKGERGLATVHVRDAITAKVRFGDIVGLVGCVELLAGLAADGDDGERAAQLLGAAKRLWDTFGLPMADSAFPAAEHRRTKECAIKLLGERGYQEAFDLGNQLGLDDAIRYALGRREDLPAPFSGGTDPLTAREAEVAELVAAGLSNREIAERLVIAKRTADSHVEHILVKLGYTTRAQIAAWITAQRRVTG
jgi:non-specific serine/threonine protein kinase